jgi:hypothetical protein
MRIEFSSTTHPSRVAKNLAKHLAASGGRQVKLVEAQNITAGMFGYDNWRELAKCSGKSGESAWDESIQESERAARRTGYVAALTARGIPEDLAASVVDTIRPTARRLQAIGSRTGWRDRLRQRIDSNGFFGVESDLAQYEWPLRFPDGCRGGRGQTRELSVGLPSGSSAVLRIRQSPNMTECGDVRVSPIEAVLIGDGRVWGYASGNVVTCPDGSGTEEYDFFDACDQVEDDIAAAANRLAGLYGMDALFGASNAIFVIDRWDAARGIAAAGTGIAFLKALLSSLKRSYRIGSVAIDLSPAQFKDIDHDKRLRTQGYAQARNNLKSYWDKAAPHDVLGPEARTFHYDLKPGTGSTFDDGLFLTGSRMAEHHAETPGQVQIEQIVAAYDAMSREDQARFVEENPFLASMVKEATRTVPTKPKPLMPDDFPSDFDIEWARDTRGFDPHPDLWRHMPSDIVSIKVSFHDIGKGLRDVEKVTYRFDNETELDIAGDYLIGGSDLLGVPPAFIAGNGFPVIVNPHTGKYLMARLAETLQVNSLLLFSGRRDRPLRYPNEAQVTRHGPIAG